MDIRRLSLAVIATTTPRLTAEEKLLLIRCLHLYGDSAVGRPVRQLEVLIGVGNELLKRTREGLVAKGLLKEKEVAAARSSEGKLLGGRLPKVFQVSERCLDMLYHGVEMAGGIEKGKKVREGWDKEALLNRLIASAHKDSITGLIFLGEELGQGNDLIALANTERASEKEGVGKSKLKLPRYGTRLLLATLLGLADPGGVVRGIGMGLLARLVGIKRQSLEYQLGKLVEEGYLRAHTPGVSGRFAYGQSAGAFFLKIGHPDLLTPIPELLVCCRDNFILRDCAFVVGSRVYRTARFGQGRIQAEANYRKKQFRLFRELMSPEDKNKSKDVGPAEQLLELIKLAQGPCLDGHEEGQPKLNQYLIPDVHAPYGPMRGTGSTALWLMWHHYGLHRVFADNLNYGEFPRYLQSRVEEYASLLLTDCWGRIDEEWFIPDGLLARIKADMLPDAIMKKAWGACPEHMPDALGYYVYILALGMAYWIKAMLLHDLPSAIGQALESARAHITVLPVPDLRDNVGPIRFAVCLVAKAPEQPLPCRTVGITRDLQRQSSLFTQENYDLDLQKEAYWLIPAGIKEELKKKPSQKKKGEKDVGAQDGAAK